MKFRTKFMTILAVLCCSCSQEASSAVKKTPLDAFKEKFQEKYNGNYDFEDGWYTAFSTTDYRETHAGNNKGARKDCSFEETRVTGNFRFSNQYPSIVILGDDSFKQIQVAYETCLTAETDEMSYFHQLGSYYPSYRESMLVNGNTVYSAKGPYLYDPDGNIYHGEQTRVKTRDDWASSASVSFQFSDYFNKLEQYETYSGILYSETYYHTGDVPYYVVAEDAHCYIYFFNDSFNENILSIDYHVCDSAPVLPKVNRNYHCEFFFDDDLQIRRVDEHIIMTSYVEDDAKQGGYYQKIWDYHLSFEKCDPISITIPSSSYDQEYTENNKGYWLV